MPRVLFCINDSFSLDLLFYVSHIFATLNALVSLPILLIPIAILLIQLFAVGSGYGYHFIALTQIHHADPLGITPGSADRVDIGADDNATGRDNHQLVVFLGDDTGCRD